MILSPKRTPLVTATRMDISALLAAKMGMWEWEIGSDKVTWTEGIEPLFGLKPGEFDGTFAMFVSRIPPEDRPILHTAINRALETGELFVVEHRVLHDNGAMRWVRGQGDTIRDENGRPIKMVGTSQDVTERVKEKAALRDALERAESANRLKSAIMASMSHEIRTPMTAILGYSELLLSHLKTQPELQYAQVINTGGRRLLHLLDNIMDLARIEADKLELVCEAHPLRDVVARVKEIMQILADRKGLELFIETHEDVWSWSDPRRVEQVITNLVSNAIRFTETGSITVRTATVSEANGSFAEIAIEDTGIGMEGSFLPHAFEEFRQESEGITRSHEGSGLGLSIVQRLLEKMGGRINIISSRGIGTRVSVLLPLATPSGQTTPLPVREPVEPKNSRKSLLVVEDDESIGVLIQSLLSQTYQVDWHANAEAALEALEQGAKVDAALLDIHLKPGRMDGLSAFRLIQSKIRPGLPVLAITAYAMKGDQDRFLAEGFAGYLPKPFDSQQLHDAIAKMFAG